MSEIEAAAERVLLAMFGGADMFLMREHVRRLQERHREENTVEWQQAMNYAKAALEKRS